MNKRNFTVTVIILVCTLILLLSACSNNSDTEITQTTNKTVEENNTNSDAESSSASAQATSIDNNSAVFSYPIKDFYSSREEIEAEKEALSTSYYKFEVGKDLHTRENAEEAYKNYMKILGEWLDKYPPSEKDILSEKERMLNQNLTFAKDDLSYAKRSYEKNPTPENKEKVERFEKNYENAKFTLEQYNNGEITIDDALEKENIATSKLLEQYYEQIENVK